MYISSRFRNECTIKYRYNLCTNIFCSGLQIALVELKRQHPGTYKFSHPRAYKLGTIAGSSDNTERFLMGRQVKLQFVLNEIRQLVLTLKPFKG